MKTTQTPAKKKPAHKRVSALRLHDLQEKVIPALMLHIESEPIQEADTRRRECYGLPPALASDEDEPLRRGVIGAMMLEIRDGVEVKANTRYIGKMATRAIQKGDHTFFRWMECALKKIVDTDPHLKSTITRLLDIKCSLIAKHGHAPSRDELENEARAANIPVDRYDRVWRTPGLSGLRKV